METITMAPLALSPLEGGDPMAELKALGLMVDAPAAPARATDTPDTLPRRDSPAEEQPAAVDPGTQGGADGPRPVHNPESLTRLTEDLAEKQRLVARLSHDVDQHRVALHRLGEEVVQIRGTKERLEEGNAALQAEIASHVDDIILDPRDLYSADRETVLHAQGEALLVQRAPLAQQRLLPVVSPRPTHLPTSHRA